MHKCTCIISNSVSGPYLSLVFYTVKKGYINIFLKLYSYKFEAYFCQIKELLLCEMIDVLMNILVIVITIYMYNKSCCTI